MKQYKGRKLTIAAFVVVSAIVGIATLTVQALPQMSPTSTTPQPALTNDLKKKTPSLAAAPLQTLHPDTPVRLRIPALNIDAIVTSVGLLQNGEMEAPGDHESVAWYKYGYLPGTVGNAAMAAHSEYKKKKGVFHNLDALSPNDTMEVMTKSHVLTFRVQSKQTYEAASQQSSIFGPTTTARLNLITCSGVWDEKAKQYRDRLVAHAVFTGEKER